MGKTVRKTPAEILIELKRTESAPALDALVQRYFAMVYSTCLRITHDRHDAEDASQAAFLCLARQMRDHKDIRAMGPWLYQVACNASVDICRRRKRRAAYEPLCARPAATSVLDDPARNADLAETRPAVLEALNDLPTRYRLPLILHYFGGMSQEQLAKELACKVNTLRVRLHRGHRLLRKVLEKRGICLAGGLLGVVLAEAVRSQVSDGLIATTIALGRQASDLGLSACSAGPDVLAAASTAGAPVGRLKIWIALSLAVASVLTAGVPLVSRLRDLPNLTKPLDIAPLRLPELISPLPKLSSAHPSLPAPPSAPIAAAESARGPGRAQPSSPSPDPAAPANEVAAAPPAAADPPAEPSPFTPGAQPQLSSPAAAAASAQVSPVVTPTSRTAASAASDVALRAAPEARHQAPFGYIPSTYAAARPVASRGNTGNIATHPPVTDSPTVIAATFQPATVNPWAPANAGARGHGADYIALADENNPEGWLVYLDGPGGAVDALYATHTTASPQVLRGRTSISDALNSAIATAYTQSPSTTPQSPQPLQVLRNNGQVVADGRTEDFTWCDRVQNDQDNPRGGFNGWFATNGGRIDLPSIKVHRGTQTYNWGEDASDTAIDLINSMRITATASSDSELAISLLATDSTGLPLFPTGHHFISAYQLTGGDTIFGPMHTTVRYDDARLTWLGLNENYVKLWYYTDPGAGWQRAFASFDRNVRNDWVSADIPADAHYIAVSTPEPASATAIAITGALVLLRRRRA